MERTKRKKQQIKIKTQKKKTHPELKCLPYLSTQRAIIVMLLLSSSDQAIPSNPKYMGDPMTFYPYSFPNTLTNLRYRCRASTFTTSHPPSLVPKDYLVCMVGVLGHFYIKGGEVTPSTSTFDNLRFEISSPAPGTQFRIEQIAFNSQGQAAITFRDKDSPDRKIWMLDFTEEYVKQQGGSLPTQADFLKIDPLNPLGGTWGTVTHMDSAFNDKCSSAGCEEFFIIREGSERLLAYPSPKFYELQMSKSIGDPEFGSYPFIVFSSGTFKAYAIRSFYSPQGTSDGLKSGIFFRKRIKYSSNNQDNTICLRFFRQNELERIDLLNFLSSTTTAIKSQLAVFIDFTEDHCISSSFTNMNLKSSVYRVRGDRVFIFDRNQFKVRVHDLSYPSGGGVTSSEVAVVDVPSDTTYFSNVKDSKEIFYIVKETKMTMQRPQIGQILYERTIGANKIHKSFEGYSQKYILAIEEDQPAANSNSIQFKWYSGPMPDCTSIMGGNCEWCDENGNLRCALCKSGYRSTIDHQCIPANQCSYSGTDTNEVCKNNCKYTRGLACLECEKDGNIEKYNCVSCQGTSSETGIITNSEGNYCKCLANDQSLTGNNATPCASCGPGCSSCKDYQQNFCYSCDDGNAPQPDKTCNIQPCPDSCNCDTNPLCTACKPNFSASGTPNIDLSCSCAYPFKSQGTSTCTCPANSSKNGATCDCDSGYGKEDNAGVEIICHACPQDCTQCDYENGANAHNTRCTNCGPSNMEITSSGLCQCLTGFYYQSSGTPKCVPCQNLNSHCQECISNQCTKCEDGYLPSGSSCNQCTAPCKTCSGSVTTCTDCYADRYLDGNHCQLCSSAITNCIECSTSAVCEVCVTNYNFDSGQGLCVHQGCPSNQYPDNNGVCQNCDSSCASCSAGGPSACTSCDKNSATHKYLFNNKCQASCDTSNGFIDFDSGGQLGLSCHPCPPNCKACSISSNPNTPSCTQCIDPRYAPEASSPQCPDPSTVCHVTCTKTQCTQNNNPTKCKQCFDTNQHLRLASVTMVAGFCAGSCFLNEVEVISGSSKKCIPCSAALCSQCQSGEPLKCRICNQGYYSDSNGECKACHEACLSCNGSGYLDCTSCKGPEFFKVSLDLQEVPSEVKQAAVQKNNLLCGKSCSTKFYYDYYLSSCQSCDARCFECTTKATNCISCGSGFILEPSSGKCLTPVQCVDKKFISNPEAGTSECLPCGESCGNCQETSVKCTSCPMNQYLFGESCLSVCPSGYYQTEEISSILGLEVRICAKCEESCLTCDRQSTRCKSCHNNDDATFPLLALEEEKCYSKCPAKTYMSGKFCLKCKEPCVECSDNPLNCLSCTKEYIYDEGLDVESKCRILCKEGFAWIKPNNCKECLLNCLSCEDETLNCKTCQEGFEKDEKDPKRCLYIVPKELSMEAKNFFRKTSSVHFRFDKEIQTKDFQRVMSVTLIDQGEPSEDPEGYSYTLERSVNQKELIVKIDFKKAYTNGILTVHNTSKRNIASLPLDEDLTDIHYFTGESLAFKNINFFEDKAFTESFESSKSSGKATLGTTSMVSILASPGFGTVTVKLYQMFDILKLFNIKWPINFLRYLELFETSIFDMVPSIYKIDESKICKPHPILQENEISCLFLNNSASPLIEIFVIIVLKLLLMVLLKKRFQRNSTQVFKKKAANTKEIQPLNSDKPREDNLVTRLISKLNLVFNIAFFVEMMLSMEIDILLSVFSNLREYWISPAVVFSNTTLSFVMLFFYIFLIRHVAHNSIRLEVLKNKPKGSSIQAIEFRKEWGFLKSEYKKGVKGLASFSHELVVVRDFFICFFIVIFIEVPFIQILPSLAFFVFTFLIQAINQPYENFCMNLLSTINQAVYVIILVISLLLKILGDQEAISEQKRQLYFGWPLIIITTLCVASNVIVGFYETFMTVKEILCVNKGKKKQNSSKKRIESTSEFGEDRAIDRSEFEGKNLFNPNGNNPSKNVRPRSTTQRKRVKNYEECDLNRKEIEIKLEDELSNLEKEENPKLSRLQKKRRKKFKNGPWNKGNFFAFRQID